MESSGRITSITRDIKTDNYIVTLSIPDLPVDLDDKVLDVRLVPHRNRRSLDANAMLWACIGDIAKKLSTDKWDVYLHMLKHYGVFETISAKVEAIDAVRRVWREIEVVDTKTDLTGDVIATINCYIGSSSYNTYEMSVLIDGVISEMKELGLQLPPSDDLKRALDLWEKKNG